MLTLPQGWRAKSVTFNHSPIEPTVSGITKHTTTARSRKKRGMIFIK
jgi:hypothetical protein